MRAVPFIAVAALLSSAALGYAQGGQDFSKVQLKATKVAGNIYSIWPK